MHGNRSLSMWDPYYLACLTFKHWMTSTWGNVFCCFFLGYLGKPHIDIRPDLSYLLSPHSFRITHTGLPLSVCVCRWATVSDAVCEDGCASTFDFQEGGKVPVNTLTRLTSASQTPHTFHEHTERKSSPNEDTLRARDIISAAVTAWVSDVGGMMSQNISAHLSPLLLSSKWASSVSLTKISLERSLMYTQVLLKCESLFPCQLPATVKYTPWSSRLIRVQKEILQTCDVLKTCGVIWRQHEFANFIYF